MRAKPQAIANLTYRDALFPRTEYRRCWDALTAAGPLRQACRIMVGLLWLAHDQTCEAELAAALSAILARGELPVLGNCAPASRGPKAMVGPMSRSASPLPAATMT
ncbi:integrase catalytic subunit (plasmid) [Frigidibacter mobilis]|uniref:Integrase catalytic subunit n=1 Tax=Frigidibacter mobilis TaxID=1335048 RepID=A0A159Z8X5_9RHOB|nr:integrase catalytic subunit [Frigidibacter mobilis]